MSTRRWIRGGMLAGLVALSLCAGDPRLLAGQDATPRGEQSGGAADIEFPLRPDSVRFAVIGDMGTGDQFQQDVARQMVRSRSTFPFGFVILLGDNILTGDEPADFERAFAVPYKPLLDDGVAFYAVLGNHDSSRQRSYTPFNMNGASYYTFKKGNVRFFVLDSEKMDARQIAWLESGLQNGSDGDWSICCVHKPLYSAAATHGADGGLRKVLEPLFEKYGVNVVFSGHNHVYERMVPQRGVHYFVEGASGRLRVANLTRSSILARGFDRDCSFMMIEIAGDDMYFRTVSRRALTVDAGVIHRTIRPAS
jgi:predicted phosphodiesterase